MRSFVCFCVFWQLQEILDESTDLKDFAFQELPILPVCSFSLALQASKKKKVHQSSWELYGNQVPSRAVLHPHCTVQTDVWTEQEN